MVEIETDPAIHEQQLSIHVTELGPERILKEVRFEGLTRHSNDLLAEYLSIKPGMRWNETEMLRVQRLLFESGRFQCHCVSTMPPLLGPEPAIATIQVCESDNIPLCYESLSEDDERLRRGALDLGNSLFLLCEILPSGDVTPFEQTHPIMEILSDKGQTLIRLASHLDQFDRWEFQIAGVDPVSSKPGEKSGFKMGSFMIGETQQKKSVGFVVAPFLEYVLLKPAASSIKS